MSKKKNKLKQNNFKKYFWIMFFLFVTIIPIIFYFASLGFFGFMPDHTALENPRTNLATEVISSDGITLGKFYYEDNRTPVTYNELPVHLVNALIATEDRRFFDHAGIDAKGTCLLYTSPSPRDLG